MRKQKHIEKILLLAVFLILVVSLAFAAVSSNNPSACSGAWTSCTNAFTDDGTIATASSGNSGEWQGYGFSVPVGDQIDRVELQIDFFASETNGYIDVQVSDDGGTTYGPVHSVGGNVAEQTYLIDVTDDFSWTPTGVSDSNLRVKVDCTKIGKGRPPTCSMDYLAVTVEHNLAVCTRGSPIVVISPATQRTDAGNVLQYTVDVTSGDTDACGSSAFDLTHSIPSGWSGTFAATPLTISGGATSQTTFSLTSSPTALVGSEMFTITATNQDSLLTGESSAMYEVVDAGSPVILMKDPSTCSGEWSSCGNAFTDGGGSASASTGIGGTWDGYSFAVPTNALIDMVEISVDFAATSTNTFVDIQVSNDGGVTYGTAHRIGGNAVEQTFLINLTSDFAWTASGINDPNFMVRAACVKEGRGRGGDCMLDYLPVEIVYRVPEQVDTIPVANPSATPSSGDELLNVSFTGNFTDGESPFTFTWDFNDGGNATVQNPTHRFSAGTYNVSFTVTDVDGDADTANVLVTVNSVVCTPMTCESLGAFCGNLSDGCGGQLDCGTCTNGQVCDMNLYMCVPPTASPIIIDQRIATGEDDAEESSTGSISRSSSDLELMTDNSTQRAVLVRYQLNIPPGATIQNAYLQFTVDETTSEATQLTIAGEASDNSSPVSPMDYDLSTRPTTTASVSWAPVPWTSVDEEGPDQRTPELMTVLQEVINRPGWLAGNFMSFLINGTGKRVARSYNSAAEKSALLHVEYLPQCTVDTDCPFGQQCSASMCVAPLNLYVPPPNFKVAFIADTDYGSDFQGVLTLIKNEDADMVIHAGDLGYGTSSEPFVPGLWEDDIETVLDPSWQSSGKMTEFNTTCSLFPYFISMGNHENGDVLSHWTQESNSSGYRGYREFLRDRVNCHGIALDNDANPNNDGTRSSFAYQNLFVALMAPGESCTMDCGGTDAEKIDYIRRKMGGNQYLWDIGAWHKLMDALQVGDKGDSHSYDTYDEVRKAGGIIATAHEHSYERTWVLDSFSSCSPHTNTTSSCSVVDTVDPLTIKPDEDGLPGQTFAFVSGAGGKSLQPQLRCADNPTNGAYNYPYGCNGEWASIMTEEDFGGSTVFGAFFIEFNIDGDPRKARAYFKTVDGQVWENEPFIINNTAPGILVN